MKNLIQMNCQTRYQNDYFLLLLLLKLLFLLNNDFAYAISSGGVGICDADFKKFGCNKWAYTNENPDWAEAGSPQVIDRFACIDPDAGSRIMSWVKAPEKTALFAVRSSREGKERKNDPIMYRPGGWYQPIHVLTMDYYKKYRGLMLYAVDKNNQPVGSWALPDDPDFNFWHPPTCGPTHVLHQDSGVKNFNNVFQFRTPPPGTGPITFKALIKVGPANTGEFYYPDIPLVLQEEEIPDKKLEEDDWVLGNIGESCDDVCYREKMQCETARLVNSLPKSIVEFETLTSNLFPCYPPYLNDCSMGSPAASANPDYQCYVHDKEACEGKKSKETVTCEAYGTDRRFCICKDVHGKRFLRLANDDINDVQEMEVWTKENITSLVLKTTCMISSFLALIKLMCKRNNNNNNIIIGNKERRNHFILGICIIITLSTIFLVSLPQNIFVSAHNWPMGRTRGSYKMPTVARASCMADKNNIHHQIGVGQHYLQGFSTGHGGVVTLVTVHHDHAWYLEDHRKLKKYAQGYVHLRPKGSNTALTKEYRRTHVVDEPFWQRFGYSNLADSTTGCKVCPTCDRDSDQHGVESQCSFKDNNLTALADYLRYFKLKNGFRDINCCKYCRESYGVNPALGIVCNRRRNFKNKFQKSRCDSDWCTRIIKPGEPGHFSTACNGCRGYGHRGSLYEYTEQALSPRGRTDMRLDYKSDVYPWIDSVHTYKIRTAGQPYDWDIFKVGVSGNHGPGKYTTIMFWLGYSYCTDFEYFDDRKIEHINGNPNALIESEWVRDDHCVFNTVSKYLTPLWPADSGDNCATAMGMLRDQYGFLPTKRGIQILPVKKPKNTHDGYQLPLDWNNTNLVHGSPYMVVNGDITRSDDGVDFFTKFKTSWAKQKIPRKYCRKGRATTGTLRDVLLQCSMDIACKGISAKTGTSNIDNVLYTGVHNFMVCGEVTGSHLASNANWATYVHDTSNGGTEPSSSPHIPINDHLNSGGNITINFGYDQLPGHFCETNGADWKENEGEYQKKTGSHLYPPFKEQVISLGQFFEERNDDDFEIPIAEGNTTVSYLISTKTNIKYPLYFKIEDLVKKRDTGLEGRGGSIEHIYKTAYSCSEYPEKCNIISAKEVWESSAPYIRRNVLCKGRISYFKDNLGTLGEALSQCYADRSCTGITARKHPDNANLYTGVNTFEGCSTTKVFSNSHYVVLDKMGIEPRLYNVIGNPNQLQGMDTVITKSNYKNYLFYSVYLNEDYLSGHGYALDGILGEIKVHPDPAGNVFKGEKTKWKQSTWDIYNGLVMRAGCVQKTCGCAPATGGCEEDNPPGDPSGGIYTTGGCNKDPSVTFTDSCSCTADSLFTATTPPQLNTENLWMGNELMKWIFHGPIGQSKCDEHEKIVEDKICELCHTPQCHWLYLREGLQRKTNCFDGYMYGKTLEESERNFFRSYCRNPLLGQGATYQPQCTCDCIGVHNYKYCDINGRSTDPDCGKYLSYKLDNNMTDKAIADDIINKRIGENGQSTCGYEYVWNTETVNIYDTPMCKRCKARTDIQGLKIDQEMPADPTGYLRDVGNPYEAHVLNTNINVNYGWNCDFSKPVSFHPFERDKIRSSTMGFVDFGMQFEGRNFPVDKYNRFGGTIEFQEWRADYSMLENVCPSDEEDPKWEIELPNGRYKVQLEGYFLTDRYAGCIIENTKLGEPSYRTWPERRRLPMKNFKKWVHYIALTDGRLTLHSERPKEIKTYEAFGGSGDYGAWTTIKQPRMCVGYFKKIIIERDSEGLNTMFMPTPTKTWWQLKVDGEASERENIGIVSVAPGNIDLRNPSTQFNPRTRLIMEGNWVGAGAEVGVFKDVDNMGFKVSLSNSPCDALNGCPPPHHTCAVQNTPNYITRERYDPNTKSGRPTAAYEEVEQCESTVQKERRCQVYCKFNSKCFDNCMENSGNGKCRKIKVKTYAVTKNVETFLAPYEINCGGVAAKYIRVELHGEKRILDATITVHRNKPLQKHLDMWPTACHGIEYHDGTITNGPLVETNDAYDPVFFGTCYTLLNAMKGWVRHPNRTKKFNIRWKYGEKCLKCDKYKELKNGAQSDTQEKFEFINWEKAMDFSGQCFDCDEPMLKFDIKQIRRHYQPGSEDKTAARVFKEQMDHAEKLFVLKHTVQIYGISKATMEANKAEVKLAIGRVLSIDPNYISSISFETIVDRDETRRSRQLIEDNDEGVSPDFGIDTSETLYDSEKPTVVAKSKINYEVTIADDENNYNAIQIMMRSSNFETNIAREIAIATGTSPNGVSAETVIEPQVYIKDLSKDNDKNTNDETDKNNSNWIGYFVLAIVLSCCMCGCIKLKPWTLAAKRRTENNIFQHFQNERGRAKMPDPQKSSGKNSNILKNNSSEIELPAVAITFSEVQGGEDNIETIPAKVGDEVDTYMGKGEILQIRNDGFEVIKLHTWQLQKNGASNRQHCAILYILTKERKKKTR